MAELVEPAVSGIAVEDIVVAVVEVQKLAGTVEVLALVLLAGVLEQKLVVGAEAVTPAHLVPVAQFEVLPAIFRL